MTDAAPPDRRARRTTQPRPASEARPAGEARPASEARPAGEPRPAGEAPLEPEMGAAGQAPPEDAPPEGAPPEGAPAADAAQAPVSVPLLMPRGGTPRPIEKRTELDRLAARMRAGHGPVAVDAERASGYRYGARAYLVQIRREGAGSALIDPLPLGDLRVLAEAIIDAEWVLHAASQDLPCLAEVGMQPTQLFDTELAARLAGFERVGLAALTEQMLGYSLEKHHSAADWSTRPLPDSWLTYAALDVELLIDLRELLGEELDRQGKSAWAAEEFAALVTWGGQPPKPRPDPWRRTSGIHRVRGTRALARVRALWYARDEVAARRDSAPGRVLADAAIIAAAEMDPRDERSLLMLPGFGGRSVRRLATIWLDALERARELPDDAVPTNPPNDGPPPPHRWAERDPVAAARLARCRVQVTTIAASHTLPPENLIAPDAVRRLAWAPPAPLAAATVDEALASAGVRPWQRGLTVDALTGALADP